MKDDVARKRRTIRGKPFLRIPKATLPHWHAALDAERNLQSDLKDARLDSIDREIIERDLAVATAHREWMMLDILQFGGWLHDERNNERTSRRGRPADPEIAFRDKRMAAHSLLLELEGNPTKAAVDGIVKLYRVPRSTVYAARKRWCPLLRKLGYHRVSLRQLRIQTLEWYCARLLFESE
jgi:hypothetical protein